MERNFEKRDRPQRVAPTIAPLSQHSPRGACRPVASIGTGSDYAGCFFLYAVPFDAGPSFSSEGRRPAAFPCTTEGPSCPTTGHHHRRTSPSSGIGMACILLGMHCCHLRATSAALTLLCQPHGSVPFCFVRQQMILARDRNPTSVGEQQL